MNNIVEKLILGCLTSAFLGVFSFTAPAQDKWKLAVPVPKPAPASHLIAHGILPIGDDTYEKSITVAPNVSLTLCVVQGKLRVNGWRRSEVRIFVRSGSRFTFKVREQ